MEKVKTYKEYNDFLNGRGDTFVFRGQACANYVLIPSGLRGNHIKVADQQMFEFVDKMKALFGFDELTCIELAQHFALPTRMLDFSYSFDVALFFACYDPKRKHLDEDGKVFIVNKTKYERMLKEQNRVSSQISRNNKALYGWLQKYTDKEKTDLGKEGIDLPIFIDATQQFDRLYMQKALFLLWGKYECPFEEMMANENIDINDFVDTIVIAKESKAQILEDLAKKNIMEDTLYMNVAKIKEFVSAIKEV